jgi:hypothetical protein
MRSRWYLLLFAVFALACVSLAQTPQGHRLLGAVGIYEEPAAYSELAFTTPGALPNTLPTLSASVTVSFGIHNVSSASRSYDWSISLVHSGVSKVKASGTVSTSAQGRAAVTRSVVPACTGGQVQVVVRLASPAESISFWMTCPTAPTKTKTKASQ